MLKKNDVPKAEPHAVTPLITTHAYKICQYNLEESFIQRLVGTQHGAERPENVYVKPER